MHRRTIIKLGALAALAPTPQPTIVAHGATPSEPPAAIMMAGTDAAWSNHHPGPSPKSPLTAPTLLDTGEGPLHGFQTTLLATPTRVIAFGTFPDDVLAFDRTTGELLWRTKTPLHMVQHAPPTFLGNSLFLISAEPDVPEDEGVAPVHVTTIDLATGAVTAWPDTFEAGFGTRLVTSRGTLLAAGPVGVIAFDPSTGSVLWHHEPAGAHEVHALLANDTQVVVGWAGEASYQGTVLDLATGDHILQAPIDGSLHAVRNDEWMVLGRDRLIGYASATGVETWSIPLPISAPHTLAFDADGVIVASTEAVVAVDPASEEVTWQVAPGLADPTGYGLALCSNRLAITGAAGGRWLDRTTGETLQDLTPSPPGNPISLRGLAVIDGTIWGSTSAGVVRWEGTA